MDVFNSALLIGVRIVVFVLISCDYKHHRRGIDSSLMEMQSVFTVALATYDEICDSE